MILVVHLGEKKDRKDRMEIHCFPDSGRCEIRDVFPNGESAGVAKCSIHRLREIMLSAIAESRQELASRDNQSTTTAREGTTKG